MPNLRAFAHSLCGDSQLSNDLVQETLLKAWAHKDFFVPDSNLKAWLFTILRNTYFTHYRKSQREELDEDHAAMNASVPPTQLMQLEFDRHAQGPHAPIARSSRSPAADHRGRLLIRGRRTGLRMRHRHDEKQGQSRQEPARGGNLGADAGRRHASSIRARHGYGSWSHGAPIFSQNVEPLIQRDGRTNILGPALDQLTPFMSF